MIPRYSSTDSTSSSPSITPFTSGPATHQMDDRYSRNAMLKTPTMSTNVTSSKHPSSAMVGQSSIGSGSVSGLDQFIGRNMDPYYLNGIKNSIQKWFSNFGFPGGPLPIEIPKTIRKLSDKRSGLQKGSSQVISGVRKELPTIYDMITHLVGRSLTSMPINQPLPTERSKRVKQLSWLNSVLLKFLSAQGGSVNQIRPDFLMEWDDFCHNRKMENLPKMSRDVFEIVSTHSWTDFLLQLYKCLVLPRCMDSEDGHDEVQSNLYSQPELNLLAWLNSIYDQERGNMFDDYDLPVRWIVNFDFDLMDGLVIGRCLQYTVSTFIIAQSIYGSL